MYDLLCHIALLETVSSAEADSDLFRTRFPRTYVLGSVLASAKADF
jgi:hypothetical protein